MKGENTKKENKTCFILYTITALIFMVSGIIEIISDGIAWSCITSIALGITFGSIAVIYFNRYKSSK